jgi:hypothetical protein
MLVSDAFITSKGCFRSTFHNSKMPRLRFDLNEELVYSSTFERELLIH